jgi:argininosuccinate lyase
MNSMDAVSDRDFVVEFAAGAALLGVHLSRLAEDLVLWSSSEFNFVRLREDFTSGSSLMPQKKNPDVAELVRGKTGRVYGDLLALLTTMKGLPLAYDKDMQEDKEGLFDAVDTLLPSLSTMAGMVRTATINERAMTAAVERSFALATDVADYLVGKGLPFRQAHEVAGRLVRWCVENNRTMASLTLPDYQQFSPLFTADVLDISVQTSLAARNSPGGTAPQRVRAALDAAKMRVDENAKWLEKLLGGDTNL